MSKAKRLNTKKSKKIKETIIGLTLAISIGIIGSSGSYAYFSDKINADNGIKITMGTLDVGIGEGFKLTEFEQNKPEKPKVYTKDFTIENTGTLDEILTLKFENVSFNGYSDYENLAKVKYRLQIGGKTIECTLNELSTQGVNIGRLDSGKSISCSATLQNNGIEPNYEQDTVIKFNLAVDGIQINDTTSRKGGAN